MNIEWYRDLAICILGFVASGALIFIVVLSYLSYRKVSDVLDSIKAASNSVQSLSTRLSEEVVKPLIQVIALFQGIRRGVNTFSRLFRR